MDLALLPIPLRIHRHGDPEPDAPCSERSERLEHQRMCGLEREGGEIGDESRDGKMLDRLESHTKSLAYPSTVQYGAL